MMKMEMETKDRDLMLCFVSVEKDIEYIKQNVHEINNKLEKQYITRMEFEPIKRIVYGMVGLILTSVVVAVIGLVLTR